MRDCRAISLAMLSSIWGCGDNEAILPDGAAPPPPITGVVLKTYVLETGSTEAPVDLAGVTPTVTFVDEGQWRTVAGVGSSDGSFVIDGVPDGPYLLEVGEILLGGQFTGVATTERTLLLRDIDRGRPTVQHPTDIEGTSLRLRLSGLDPWQEDDEIELMSLNAGVSIGWNGLWTGLPLLGAVAADDLSYPWGLGFANLVAASSGDVVRVYQLSSSGDSAPKTLTRYAETSGFSIMDGETVDLVLDLSSEGFAEHDAVVMWDRNSFAALGPTMYPDATPLDSGVRVDVFAGTPEAAVRAGTLAKIERVGASGTETLSLRYAVPFPNEWWASTSYSVTFFVELHADFVAQPVVLSLYGRLSGVDSATVEARLSPVRALRLDGVQPGSAAEGVGLTPTIRWEPPEIGVPDAVDVFIFDTTEDTPALYVRVLADRFAVPPGVLKDRHWYYAKTQAVDGVVATRPFDWSPEFHGAEAVTDLFMP